MLARRNGFTLIELLVVVAIIALLIAILLPSLSKARQQARTTLCASRLAQMLKAMLMYAEDFEERPPFVCTGMGDPPDHPETYKLEDWISKDMDLIWLTHEDDWPSGLCPQSGSLFPYTRFADLYRCPEFERIGGKTQSVFNYTRTLLGRKVIFPWEPGGEQYYRVLGLGHILRPSEVHSPSEMFMLVDESWQFHVADSAHYQTRVVDGPRCADPIWFGFTSEYGRYHGPPSPILEGTISDEGVPEPDAIKRAGLGFYDGHVHLEPDPVPGRNVSQVFRWLPNGIDYVMRLAFAQRGVRPTDGQILDLVRRLFK